MFSFWSVNWFIGSWNWAFLCILGFLARAITPSKLHWDCLGRFYGILWWKLNNFCSLSSIHFVFVSELLDMKIPLISWQVLIRMSHIYKSITMMRGKSPRSNVEITKKTKFRGGHLGFLTGISQSILTKLGTHI